MRFDTLSECRQYAVQQANQYGFNLVGNIELEPMQYSSQQRLTGLHSIEVVPKSGTKGTQARLQIVIERFETGRYECIAYVG